jgi:hypothetical protein
MDLLALLELNPAVGGCLGMQENVVLMHVQQHFSVSTA